MGRSVDGLKLHRKKKYSGDFIPYNLPELFQGCEKLEKFTPTQIWRKITPLNGPANDQEYLTYLHRLRISVYTVDQDKLVQLLGLFQHDRN
jgi:hypothetical protein